VAGALKAKPPPLSPEGKAALDRGRERGAMFADLARAGGPLDDERLRLAAQLVEVLRGLDAREVASVLSYANGLAEWQDG